MPLDLKPAKVPKKERKNLTSSPNTKYYFQRLVLIELGVRVEIRDTIKNSNSKAYRQVAFSNFKL